MKNSIIDKKTRKRKYRLKYLSMLLVILLLMSALATGCNTKENVKASTKTTDTLQGIAVEYSSEDMDGTWDNAKATKITLSGSTFVIDGSGAATDGDALTITKAGTYVFSGTLNDGQIVVAAGENDKVQLVLNGAKISCSDNAAIYSKTSKKTILTIAKGSENTVSDGSVYTYAKNEDEPNAAIFSKSDLTINGTGTLTVNGNYSHGICSKDDLVITGGKITVNAANDGIRGKDSIAIKNGKFTIKAGGDGLQANNDKDADKGWISLDGGTFNITSTGDGVQAETLLQSTSAKITLTTGGGSANANAKNSQNTYAKSSQDANAKSSQDTASAKGLKGSTGILINSGTFTINSADDALHSNGDVLIKGGKLNISSGDDGVHADSSLTVDSGTIHISNSYEGLEAASITVNGGTIYLKSRDDGFNAAGGNDTAATSGKPSQDEFASNDDYFIRITDGKITVNADGDGIDSNGNVFLDGGTILVSGPTNNGNAALDFNGTCKLTGGTLGIAGSSGMAQAPSDSSTQNSITVYYKAVQKAGTLVTLKDKSGNEIFSYAPVKDYQSIVISTPDLKKDSTYTLFSGEKELTKITLSSVVTEISDDGTEVTGSMGGPGGHGGLGGPRPSSPGGIGNPEGPRGAGGSGRPERPNDFSSPGGFSTPGGFTGPGSKGNPDATSGATPN